MNKVLNLSTIKAVVIRHLFEWKRDLDRVVDSFWWATIDLVSWGLVSSFIKQNNQFIPNIVAYFLGGIIFWTVVQNSQRDINMPLLTESWNKNLINLFTTPIRLREFIIGTIILGVIKLSITVTVLFLLAAFLYHFNILSIGFYFLPAVINLILTGWWVGFIISGFIFRYGYRVQPFAWAMIFVIYPFSAVIYPVSILPHWAQKVALFLPTSYIFENLRKIFYGGTFSMNDMLISTLLNIIYIIFSIIFLKFMFRKSLEHARLIKLN